MEIKVLRTGRDNPIAIAHLALNLLLASESIDRAIPDNTIRAKDMDRLLKMVTQLRRAVISLEAPLSHAMGGNKFHFLGTVEEAEAALAEIREREGEADAALKHIGPML